MEFVRCPATNGDDNFLKPRTNGVRASFINPTNALYVRTVFLLFFFHFFSHLHTFHDPRYFNPRILPTIACSSFSPALHGVTHDPHVTRKERGTIQNTETSARHLVCPTRSTSARGTDDLRTGQKKTVVRNAGATSISGAVTRGSRSRREPGRPNNWTNPPTNPRNASTTSDCHNRAVHERTREGNQSHRY